MCSYFLSSFLMVNHYKKLFVFSFFGILMGIFLQLSVIQTFFIAKSSVVSRYILIYIFFSTFISFSISLYRVPFFSSKIISGDYVVYGIRPFKYTTQFVLEEIALSVSFSTVYVLFPLIILFYLGFCIFLFIKFLISYILSIILSAQVVTFVYCFTIITKKNSSIKALFSAICSLLSGSLVPVIFMPKYFAEIIQYLPFASMVNTPIQILLNSENTILLFFFKYFGFLFFI